MIKQMTHGCSAVPQQTASAAPLGILQGRVTSQDKNNCNRFHYLTFKHKEAFKCVFLIWFAVFFLVRVTLLSFRKEILLFSQILSLEKSLGNAKRREETIWFPFSYY